MTPNSTTPKTKLDVSWTAPTMTGKPALTDYDVQYRKAHSSTWTSHSFTGTGTSTTITGLTENEHYEVQVKAINDEGEQRVVQRGPRDHQCGLEDPDHRRELRRQRRRWAR